MSKVVDINLFKQLSADELKELNTENTKEVKLLPSSKDYDWWTTKEKAGNKICDGEVFTLGVARYPNPKYYKGKFISANNNIISIKDKNIALLKYVYSITYNYFQSFYKVGTQYPQFVKEQFNNFPIPLPPLDIQEKIVAEIEVLEKKEAEAKEKVERLKEEIDEIIEGVSAEKIKISEIAEQLFAGGDLPKDGNYSLEKTEKFTIPIYANAIEKDGLYGYTNITKVNKPCITISARGTIGFTKIRTEPFYPIIRLLVLIPKEDKALLKYLEYAIQKLDLKQFGTNIPQLTVPQLSSFELPLPSLSEQEEIVSAIEKIEKEITELEQQLQAIPTEKEKILNKYL